jgi:hypothetical protein
MSKDGRAALRHLVESRVLALMGREFGVEPSERQIDARWNELERQIVSSGDTAGIATYLKKARLTREELRRFLALSFVQETLTRRALGLNDAAAVNADQQQLWMEERLKERSYVELVPPWRDGVVARGVGFEIELGEYLRYLRQRLPERDIREDCYQLLLYKRIHKRMPDVARDKVERYVAEEIERRRKDAEADPRYKGIPFERLFAAQGILFDSLSEDPSVRVAALSRLWVDRSYDDAALKRVYSDEREHFDGMFGEAIETRMLFLRGAEFKNEFNPRSFKDAERELTALKGEIKTLNDLARLALERSEDATTRETGGDLGLISAGATRVPAEILAEVARVLREGPPAGGGAHPVIVVGPIRLPTGCALLCFGARRPPPAWDLMAAHVHRELRRRFIEEVLPKQSVVTEMELE